MCVSILDIFMGSNIYNADVFSITKSGLEIRGAIVANATMFSHLLPGCSCGSKHLLLP